ncbi:M81 family metallopeptidase [Ensifer adhaerens]|uniref:M81 family metallopeptidase n=1 Tax=Ensifer adhaerens TaxID=106592 RepID=UPI001C4DE3AF|nr:M81 family metallopeptidase [Ensifer adhaerens]MBW0369862.1 M81 family metallopeptidase [Ensifer adhaerens]UCM22947.1 M81 family metallopeptidase [Ensifer adhaerens]
MKLFIAGLDTETNTFSPMQTGIEAFRENLIAYGDATGKPLNCCSSQMFVWRNAAQEKGWDVVESLCAVAEPGGRTTRAVYESFRATILDDLKAAMPVDAVMLALHGACVADGYDDVEGDLLAHVRQVVGPDVPVAAELDLHCHTTERMLANATMIATYKEYPHTDIEEVAEQLFRLMERTLAGDVKPAMGMHDCRMINTFHPHRAPLRGIVDRMKAMEGQDGVLSVSFGHGFPWGDVEDVGAKMLVVTDNDPEKAVRVARSFAREIFEAREQMRGDYLGIDAALDRAVAATSGPIVLADVSDNAGGGAPGDSTFILRRIIERGIEDVASCLYWDPIAVRMCREAGEGATLALRIGGKVGPASGDPLDLTVTVRRVASGITQRFGPTPLAIGDAVWVSAGSIDIVLNTVRTQTFHPECMTALGLDPAQKKIVVVKSSNHFRAGFEPIARDILYVSAPGALQPTFEDLAFTKLKRPYWPRVANPFAD